MLSIHMFKKGIKDVNFVVCNTDRQSLDKSPVSVKSAGSLSDEEWEPEASLKKEEKPLRKAFRT